MLNPFKYTEKDLYELMMEQGNERFGMECKHLRIKTGVCIKCLRKVITSQLTYKG